MSPELLFSFVIGYMDIIFEEKELDLMRQIKKVFDPNQILNKGKIFDA